MLHVTAVDGRVLGVTVKKMTMQRVMAKFMSKREPIPTMILTCSFVDVRTNSNDYVFVSPRRHCILTVHQKVRIYYLCETAGPVWAPFIQKMDNRGKYIIVITGSTTDINLPLAKRLVIPVPSREKIRRFHFPLTFDDDTSVAINRLIGVFLNFAI